jgi:predicted acetyltransferase
MTDAPRAAKTGAGSGGGPRTVLVVTAPLARSITDDELERFIAIARLALNGPPPTQDMVDARRKVWDLDRCHAAFDGDGTQCGSARAFATELTVPGGVVAAAAISAVGVLPTHRRRGHLRRMMEAQLKDVADRGEAVAVLVAAEYPIYGRYGYGPATEGCGLELEAPPADGWLDPPTGTTELVDNDTFPSEVRALYERARLGLPGHITYEGEYWDVVVGGEPWLGGGDEERRRNARKVLWRDTEGQIQGAAMYTMNDHWVNNRSQSELTAEVFVAATDEAERELIRFLAAVDWARTVRLGIRPVDDPVPLWLRDGRMAVLTDRSDHVWARVLDVPTALTARRYAASGRLVLQVDDPMGLAAGRFVLDAGPDGARCEPTTEEPDLVLPVGALGAAYLGGQSWARLAAADWVEEARDGAVAQASAMFTTGRAPWCPMTF